jgi:hypothetical protein
MTQSFDVNIYKGFDGRTRIHIQENNVLEDIRFTTIFVPYFHITTYQLYRDDFEKIFVRIRTAGCTI